VDLLHPGASGDLEYVAGGGLGVCREAAQECIARWPRWLASLGGKMATPRSPHISHGTPSVGNRLQVEMRTPVVAQRWRPHCAPGGGPLASGVNVLEAPLCPPQWYPQTGWSAESAQDPRKFHMGEEFFICRYDGHVKKSQQNSFIFWDWGRTIPPPQKKDRGAQF